MEYGYIAVPKCQKMNDIDFPVLPAGWVDAIPIVSNDEFGHHISKGDRSEEHVRQLFLLPQFGPIFSGVYQASKNAELDRAGIDLRAAINTSTQSGAYLQHVVNSSWIDIQVKSGERKILQGFRKKNKRGLSDSPGPIVYLNGTHPFEYLTADLALQIMAHTNKLPDPEFVSEFLTIFDRDIRDCITHPHIIRPIVTARMPLIMKLYRRGTFCEPIQVSKLLIEANGF